MNARRKTRVGSGPVKVSMAAVTAVFGLLAILLGGSAPSSAQSDFYGGSFRLKGTAGGEFVDVSWAGGGTDGQIGEMFFQDTDWHELAVNVPAQAQTVRITFHTDGVNDDGADRNVIVDYFEINGVRIETESDEVYSVGVFNGVDCDGGYRNSEFLACNGYFEFNVDDIIDPPPPPGDDQIVIVAQGATGSETMAIEVDGEVRQTWPVTAGTADYIYDGPIVTPAQQLRILFTNDGLTNTGADRNLHVLAIDVYGELFDPIELESKGVWNGTDCGIGFRSSRWLHCNGWFDVPGTSEPPPPPQETVEFSVVATGSAGDELVGVVINDEVWSTFELDTDFYIYTLRVPKPPYDSFYFVFANDGLSDSGVDRNVYVESFALDNTYIDPRDLESLGNWNGTDCGQGYRNSPWLHCNGWFNILSGGDEPPPPPPPEDGIVAAFVGQGTTGSEQVGFEINGDVVASWELSTTDERYEVILPDLPIDSAKVVFLNDAVTEAGDRNVRIESIELDGTSYNPRDLESKGSYNGTDCGIGFRNSNWLHCNGWFDLGLGDPPPPPDPDVSAPTDVACVQVFENAAGSLLSVYEWTWTNPPESEAQVEVQVAVGEEVSTFIVDVGVARFLHESGGESHRVDAITAFIGDSRASVDTRTIPCEVRRPTRGGALLASYGPNNIEVTFSDGVGHEDISHYDVTLSSGSFSQTVRVAPGGGLVSAQFDDVPADEVLVAEIRTCYSNTPFSSCSAEGIGPRYNAFVQVYLPSDDPPVNSSMGPPTNVAFAPGDSGVVQWTAPVDTDGLPSFTYQVRSFAEYGNPGFQIADGALHLGETRIPGRDSQSVTTSNGLDFTFLPESPHRFEVRACSDNGCGPWSESTDWRNADGSTTPYAP